MARCQKGSGGQGYRRNRERDVAMEAGMESRKVHWPSVTVQSRHETRLSRINVVILGMSLLAFQTADPRWLTFLHAKEQGWHVKKGERSTTIFFTKNQT